MRPVPEDRLYDGLFRTVPVPVLRQVLPRVRPSWSPFLPRVVRRRVIFVHVPKAAGTSIKTELYGKRLGGHRRIVEFEVFDHARTEQFFTFSFVRNPWDRLLSAYSYLSQGVDTNTGDAAFAARVLAATPDFESFVTRLEEPEFRHAVLTYAHFRPQAYWITMPGGDEPHLDYLGRYETLESDLRTLRELWGEPPQDPAWAAPEGDRAGSPGAVRVRTSRHDSYRDVYTPAMRELVAEVYREDIELLGYSF